MSAEYAPARSLANQMLAHRATKRRPIFARLLLSFLCSVQRRADKEGQSGARIPLFFGCSGDSAAPRLLQSRPRMTQLFSLRSLRPLVPLRIILMPATRTGLWVVSSVLALKNKVPRNLVPTRETPCFSVCLACFASCRGAVCRSGSPSPPDLRNTFMGHGLANAGSQERSTFSPNGPHQTPRTAVPREAPH